MAEPATPVSMVPHATNDTGTPEEVADALAPLARAAVVLREQSEVVGWLQVPATLKALAVFIECEATTGSAPHRAAADATKWIDEEICEQVS